MILKIHSCSSKVKELYQKALLARERSYSPYSGFAVGASIRTSDGNIYHGCNVENSSFGATVCAERVAIQKAISEQGTIQISEVMVITNTTPPSPLCGMCRQVIAEFAKNTVIYTANLEGDFQSLLFDQIFPHAFAAAHMKIKF